MAVFRLLLLLLLFVSPELGCGDGAGKSDLEKAAAEVARLQSTVRSCELLVKDTETAVLSSVAFGDGVVGFSTKRGDQTGIAFIAKEDAPLSKEAVLTTLTSGKSTDLVVDTLKSKCFDAAGEEVDDVLWTL